MDDDVAGSDTGRGTPAGGRTSFDREMSRGSNVAHRENKLTALALLYIGRGSACSSIALKSAATHAHEEARTFHARRIDLFDRRDLVETRGHKVHVWIPTGAAIHALLTPIFGFNSHGDSRQREHTA